MAQNIDQFYAQIQIARSAKTLRLRRFVGQLNRDLRRNPIQGSVKFMGSVPSFKIKDSIDTTNVDYSAGLKPHFLGVDEVTGNFHIPVSDILPGKTIAALNLPLSYNDDNAGTFFRAPFASDVAKILQEEKIKPLEGRFPLGAYNNPIDSIDEFIHLNPNLQNYGAILKNKKHGFLSSLKTVYHEIGHAASEASELSQLERYTRTQLYEGLLRGITIGRPTYSYDGMISGYDIPKLDIGEVRNITTNLIASYARGEGTAEQFALELLQHNITGRSREKNLEFFSGHLSYLDSSHFDDYFDYIEKRGVRRMVQHLHDTREPLLIDLLDPKERLSTWNFQTNFLTVDQLIDELKVHAKVTALGTMHGHFSMVSGELGEIVREKATLMVNQSLAEIQMDAVTRFAGLEGSSELAESLEQTMHEASAEVVRRGRRVVFGETIPKREVDYSIGATDAAGERFGYKGLIGREKSESIRALEVIDATRTASAKLTPKTFDKIIKSGDVAASVMRFARGL